MPTDNKQSQPLFRQEFLKAAFLYLVFRAEFLLRKQMFLFNVAYLHMNQNQNCIGMNENFIKGWIFPITSAKCIKEN